MGVSKLSAKVFFFLKVNYSFNAFLKSGQLYCLLGLHWQAQLSIMMLQPHFKTGASNNQLN